MLKRKLVVEIPVDNAVVISGPDPAEVIKYLCNESTYLIPQRGTLGVFPFRLLFPSNRCGGRADMPEIFSANIFISGNSTIQDKTSNFAGALFSLGNCSFERDLSPHLWIRYLAGEKGGERIGEILFESSIDSLLERITRNSARKAA